MRRKGPLPGKICALCIPERRFAGLFGCMARISCQCQLVLDTWRRYVARKGRFSRPRPLQGCMKRENCHGLPPGNAPRRKIATDGHLGTHRARILPRTAAHERTTAKSCRRRTLGGQLAKRLREAAQRARRIRSPGFARRDSRGASASTSGSLAGFEGRLDEQGIATRQVCEAARRTRQVRSLGFAGQLARLDRTPASQGGFAKQPNEQSQQGTKKAPLRRTAPSPQNYGRKPDPP